MDEDCLHTPCAYESQVWGQESFLECYYGEIEVKTLPIPPNAPPSSTQFTATSDSPRVAPDADLDDELDFECDRSSNGQCDDSSDKKTDSPAS